MLIRLFICIIFALVVCVIITVTRSFQIFPVFQIGNNMYASIALYYGLIAYLAAMLMRAILSGIQAENEGGGIGRILTGIFIVLTILGTSILYFFGSQLDEYYLSTILNRYGENSFVLCRDFNANGRSTRADNEMPSDFTLVFFWVGGNNDKPFWAGGFPEPYNSMIPPARRVNNQSELTHVACLQTERIRVGSANYTRSATCTEYRHDMTVYILDLNGQVIRSRVFQGSQPSECPESLRAGSHVDINGNLPRVEQIVEWVLDI